MSTLQMHCNTLQHTATHCNTMQRTATHATHYHALQRTATHCNALQLIYDRPAPNLKRIAVALCCSTLHCVAVRCSVLQRICRVDKASLHFRLEKNLKVCACLCLRLSAFLTCCSEEEMYESEEETVQSSV